MRISDWSSDVCSSDLPVQGEAARNLDLIYDSLMVASQDEIAVYYGLLAESVEYPADRSWAVFTLRPEARFSDGTPVTAEDVAWTARAVQEHAQPFTIGRASWRERACQYD